jgi:hypothetical protein
VDQVTTSPELVNIPPGGGLTPGAPAQVASSQRRIIIILASLVGFLLVALVLALLAFAFLRPSQPQGPAVTIAAPPPPPPPPFAPGPPRRTEQDVNPEELVFPGAKTVLSQNGPGARWVRQLTTDKPISAVSDWYAKKLLASTRAHQVTGEVVIFDNENLKVVLTPTDSGTNILIANER